MGLRLTGGLVRCIAVGAGNGGAIANAVIAHVLSPVTPHRAIIRKIMWRNLTGADADLLVGYADRTVAGALFRQVMPNIKALFGFDGELTEDELPIAGNTPQGFAVDLTIPTGSIGNVYVETTAIGVGAGTPMEVIIEVEEF